MKSSNTPEHSLLGKPAAYISTYDPTLLFPIARQAKRAELGVHAGTLPFFGEDIWNAYELSWLNARGKPQVAILSVHAPADSPNIVESKSFKLYLNSFNQTRIGDETALLARLQNDLTRAFAAPVRLDLTLPEQFAHVFRQGAGEPQGQLLDRLDIEIDQYSPDPALLRADFSCAAVEETLVSHLLKSNCLVTGQPDWGSVQIHYSGPQIDQESLLRYLIGFRTHNEFHEQCVERIFCDILRQCRPGKLFVYARYTRRGGLDINPWRANYSLTNAPANLRQARQ